MFLAPAYKTLVLAGNAAYFLQKSVQIVSTSTMNSDVRFGSITSSFHMICTLFANSL